MSLEIRVLCVVGAVAMFLFIATNIRLKKVQIEDSLLWIVLSAMLVVIAIFPGIPIALSRLLHFQAPSNFVFVGVIAILLAKLFSLSTEVSSLRNRLNELTQEVGLMSGGRGSAPRPQGSLEGREGRRRLQEEPRDQEQASGA